MPKTKVVITGAGGGGANNIITTIKEREEYFLIGFDISEYKAVSYTHLTLPTTPYV